MSEPPADRRYLEDFEAGQEQTYGAYEVTAEEIVAFARQFDPQPFHVDPETARETRFGGLIASGWHTACLAMRLAVLEGYLGRLDDVVGVGMEGVRWTAPVRPGDVLTVREEVLGTEPSASDPSRGVLRLEIEVLNGDGESVLTMEWIDLLERREPGAG